MLIGELKQAIDNGDYDNYTDRVDVSIEISLLEYGILRDPETTECLFCKPIFDNYEMVDDKSIVLLSCDISVDDVKEYLIDESSKGLLSYIGSSLQVELDRLDNNGLAHIIQSINQYDGWWNN